VRFAEAVRGIDFGGYLGNLVAQVGVDPYITVGFILIPIILTYFFTRYFDTPLVTGGVPKNNRELRLYEK